ncbi:unnamed protein product [Spirodela intermedia]|uniref:Uncharacterized protein n=1 Tax=Spirodela intermedia TaxID=51605 RepID=A0A7I8KER3_SPIIN|nr:unnamed protein product [Spirodela intermedia]
MSSFSTSSSRYRFQNQCWRQTRSAISSMGTFLVSGRKKRTKVDMTTTQPEKNTKMPNLKWHSMERKACAMTKVKSRFTQTVTLCPADRVSSGKVSLGMSHPSGPQDQAKDDTKVQTITTTNLQECGDDERWPVAAAQQVPERVLHLLGGATGLKDLLEFGFHIRDAANTAEHCFPFLQPAPLDETVGGLRDEQRAHREEQRRHPRKAQRQPPTPPAADPALSPIFLHHHLKPEMSKQSSELRFVDLLGGAIVDKAGEEDADGDVELEQDVEPSTDPSGRDLRQK